MTEGVWAFGQRPELVEKLLVDSHHTVSYAMTYDPHNSHLLVSLRIVSFYVCGKVTIQRCVFPMALCCRLGYAYAPPGDRNRALPRVFPGRAHCRAAANRLVAYRSAVCELRMAEVKVDPDVFWLRIMKLHKTWNVSARAPPLPCV